MENIIINTEFIKLGQFLKMSGIASSGVDAKFFITNEQVKVNEEIEVRRGRKLYDGDIIEFDDGSKFKIKKEI